jgi:tetratricopeptide (TPR) repeat protein
MTPLPPEPSHAPFERALRYALQGRFAEAVERIAPALEPHGRKANAAADALSRVARMAEAAGDPVSAERALDLAIAARPRHADLHFQRACLLLHHARRAEARAGLDRALELNPRYAAARLERAMLDAREGLLGEALESLRRLSRECASAEAAAFQRGMKRLEQAEWDEAQALLEAALRLSDPGLHEQLRRFHALMEEGGIALAMQALREAIAEHPAYPDLHALLGRTELQQGHFDDALSSLGRALELNPEYHDARIDFARALESLGMRSQAAEQVALVLEREPGHALAAELQARWCAPRHHAGSRERAGSKGS